MKRDRKLMYYLLLQARDREPPPELAKYPPDVQIYNAALLIDDGYIRGEALPDHDGVYINAVLEDLTSSGHDLLEEMEAESKIATPKVFISHSSEDIGVAKALIDLLLSAIGLNHRDIRCTSVDGYRLEVGADTDVELKRELKASKAFIGLITPSSIESAYVLFELGARWGADLHLAPVLACGADSGSLRGPLAKLNALN